MIDIREIKQLAAGRWPELLGRLGGIDVTLLDGKNHPCPHCGGKDRFRMINKGDGSLFCNQCFNKKNGDGIAAIMWLTNSSFVDTIKRIAVDLGITDQDSSIDAVQEMAWRKNVTADSLAAFGATNSTRGSFPVCRVPMHDADMIVVGHFDLASTPEFDKGKMTKGSKHGMFVAEHPKAGEVVAVVEGVKDAAALHDLGYVAVGLPTCRMSVEFARLFREVDVVVVPDRDKAGINGAKETAARLFGVAASVKVAELPAEYRETDGADVRDILMQSDGETRLRNALKNARPWGLTGTQETLALTSLPDAIRKYIDNIGIGEQFIETGLPGLDFALGGGLLPGEVMIIAGRPSHGKTAVGLQALDGISQTVPTLMITEEMSVAALAQRSICGVTRLPLDEWANSKESLRQEMDDHLSVRQPSFIVESCGTVERAVEAIARAVEHGVKAVAVDYLQLLRGRGSGRYEQITDVSVRLKQAAVKYNVVMLTLCQLNRGVEHRQTSCPRMSDLRDSGSIEQDADVILFVEWLYRTKPDAHDKEEYRMLVAKNRNREIKRSIIDCTFKPERQRIYQTAETAEIDDWPEFQDFSEPSAASS